MTLWILFISPGLAGFLPCSGMGREDYHFVMPGSGVSRFSAQCPLMPGGEELLVTAEWEWGLYVGRDPLAGSTRTPHTAPQMASPTPWWRPAYLPLSGGKVLTFSGLLWHQPSSDDAREVTLFPITSWVWETGLSPWFFWQWRDFITAQQDWVPTPCLVFPGVTPVRIWGCHVTRCWRSLAAIQSVLVKLGCRRFWLELSVNCLKDFSLLDYYFSDSLTRNMRLSWTGFYFACAHWHFGIAGFTTPLRYPRQKANPRNSPSTVSFLSSKSHQPAFSVIFKTLWYYNVQGFKLNSVGRIRKHTSRPYIKKWKSSKIAF